MTGHFKHVYDRPWKYVDRPITPLLANILGAKESEVAHHGTLTGNMHNLLTTFYKPTKERYRIVIEKGSFPTDWVSGVVSLYDSLTTTVRDPLAPAPPRRGAVAGAG